MKLVTEKNIGLTLTTQSGEMAILSTWKQERKSSWKSDNIKTTNNIREDDEGTPTITTITTPPPPTTTTVEGERKLAQILTPLWFRESEELTQKNLVVLTNSLKKVENLKAEVKKRDDLLRRLADLTEEKLQKELREKAYYERYP